MLVKGSTAMTGASVGAKAARDFSGGASCGAVSAPLAATRTAPTKRSPLRATVRISFCSAPLSPTAVRAALTRLVRVESETILPSHTAANISSLLTTRSRLRSRYSSRSNTCGSTATGAEAQSNSRRAVSSVWSAKANCMVFPNRPRRPSQGIIKPASSVNQAQGKVFRPVVRYEQPSVTAMCVIAHDRRTS